MSETLTAAAVREAINKVLTTGQSTSMADFNVSEARLSESYAMLEKLEKKESRTANRPYMRGFNLSGMGY